MIYFGIKNDALLNIDGVYYRCIVFQINKCKAIKMIEIYLHGI